MTLVLLTIKNHVFISLILFLFFVLFAGDAVIGDHLGPGVLPREEVLVGLCKWLWVFTRTHLQQIATVF